MLQSPPKTAPLPSDVLQSPVQSIRGVGEQVAALLAPLGLRTAADLLRHYPRRYEDRARFARIEELTDGQTATLVGRVTAVENKPTKNRLVLTKVTIEDGSRVTASLTWFNQWRMKAVFERLMGKSIVAYGVVKRGYTTVEMDAAGMGGVGRGRSGKGRIAEHRADCPDLSAHRGIGANRLRKIIYAAVLSCAESVEETLTARIRHERDLPPLASAIRQIHFPDDEIRRENARRRLVYDELLTMQLLLAGRKLSGKGVGGTVFADVESPVAEFESGLKFTMTGAQKRVVAEIGKDMAAPPDEPACAGGCRFGKNGGCNGRDADCGAERISGGNDGSHRDFGRAALQERPRHSRSPRRRCGFADGFHESEGKECRQGADFGRRNRCRHRNPRSDSGGCYVSQLGLAVIDEQHRFGVLQRAALSGKGAAGQPPDVLVMTATPIPRTLTLTVYGDLDVSLIDELPPGRKPIRTHWKRAKEKASVYDGVRKMLQQGRQAFVVCPLIEESDKLQVRAASDLAAHLTKEVFPEFTVGLLHGQMTSDDKDETMRRFRENEIHILVATTVIEVGVDIPNAVVMVIEDADRFGLAQLHQLRGRVGRGQHSSFCILLAEPTSENGERRMQVMTETQDGFLISEEDLRLRGPGEFYGTRQSGLPGLLIADVMKDTDILMEAREDAFALLDSDPKLAKDEHRPLRNAVVEARRRLELPTEGVTA